jgi:hypothetical protein
MLLLLMLLLLLLQFDDVSASYSGNSVVCILQHVLLIYYKHVMLIKSYLMIPKYQIILNDSEMSKHTHVRVVGARVYSMSAAVLLKS